MAEDNFELRKHVTEFTKLFDQMSRLLTMNTLITEQMQQQIKKMSLKTDRGVFVDSEDPKS